MRRLPGECLEFPRYACVLSPILNIGVHGTWIYPQKWRRRSPVGETCLNFLQRGARLISAEVRAYVFMQTVLFFRISTILPPLRGRDSRSEEHTSELQSPCNL